MPYRLNPKNKRQVQVYKNGRWQVLHTHESEAKAKAQLAALHAKRVTFTHK